MTSYFPPLKYQERAMQHLCVEFITKGQYSMLQKGAGTNFCRYPAPGSYKRPNGCKAEKPSDPWGECREAQCSMDFHGSRGANCQWESAGRLKLSCMTVLPAGHRLNQERIAYPLAALHLVCTVSKYLGKQKTRLRADFPFQGKFGSCSAVNPYQD